MAKGERKLLFSLTAADFRWDYFNGSGNGGQNRNKTQACVRCFHDPSGAVGVATEERSQQQNKVNAFRRCLNDPKFKAWHKLETARRLGTVSSVEAEVERQLKAIRIDTKDENGRWIETDPSKLT